MHPEAATSPFAPAALDRLDGWYAAHVPDHVGPFTQVTVASAGRSNITAVLRDAAGRRTVVRRPPLGQHAPTAHDVCREGRIMDALADSAVPVPRVLAICEEPSVAGAPFFVMAHVDGAVLDVIDDAASLTPSERRQLADDLATHLAVLHSLVPVDHGLGDLARADGFVERQLRRFERQWALPDDHPATVAFRRCHALLAARRPADAPSPRIVHGDYRLGNAIVAGARVAAIVDWELTTLGHPLSDLAYLLNNWVDASEAEDGPITSVIAAGGFGTRDDVMRRYAAVAGHVDQDELRYFRAVAYWRLASLRSGVAVRLAHSTDPSQADKARQSVVSVPKLIAAAEAMAERVAA